jgi:transposase
MGKFIKKKWFIGIDISKNFIDVAILNEKEPGRFISHRFPNDLKGFENMKEWYVKHEVKLSGILFCMEHTGTYGLLLFAWLSQQEADFCVEPGLQIKRIQGMTRGKNDIIDARRIASYALNKRADLKQYVLPTEILIQIKQLLTYRDQLVRLRTGLKSSLQNHREYQQITSYDFVTKDIQRQIENLDQSVIEVEKQIMALIESEENLKENFKLATSVKGVGLVIAAFMLVTTHNFTGFENGRKYACYAGIAPFPNESGTSIKGKSKVSHLGNKKLKTLLSNGANSAKSWDPEIRAYYKRKIDEGKEHKSVINAISCKLVNRVFSVVKRQTPYVSIYQQIFA